jgi:multimeric flavodoxin WrbA
MIRAQPLAADILVVATPIWLGQPASVCKMVLERPDAELSESDDEGRLLTYGKVAVAAVVGNEDGAHHTIAEVFQALNDVGFTSTSAGYRLRGGCHGFPPGARAGSRRGYIGDAD